MALTVSQIGTPGVFGNKRAVLATVTFDSSYATGGESLTPADLGLLTIDALFVDAAAAAAGATAVTVKYDKANQKLQAFSNSAVGTHTHTAGAITVASHTHTAGAITVASHLHTENTDASYTQNASTAGTVATATAAVSGGTVATAAGAVTGANGAVSVGAAAANEVASTTNLSALSCVILALGV